MNAIMNLQLFADAGTLVNTSVNYVNAGTGATTNSDGTNTLAGELKTFYDTELLENARQEMYYAQFAKRQPLPANHGKTVEWRKWNTFAKASQLQEGVIPTGQKFGMSSKTGSINQYGTYAAISDVLELRAYDDVILGATEEMGASMAETQETLIRDALLTNTNVMYCDNITLGYTFGQLGKYIKSLRLYGSVNNALTITGYEGIDPEVSSSGLAPGYDNRDTYPHTRAFTFGLNVTF